MPEDSTPQAAQPLERRLATILCADIAGYSQMMGADEERTVRVFRGHREIFESLVRMHRGRIFNTAGDALLAEFNSAVEAVRCATEIQAALRTRNEHLAPEEKMQFRIGINLGDVIIQGGDLLGDGVNVAARIQAATEPGGICISGSVHDQIQNKLSLEFKLLGEQTYKNIAKPVRTYTINEGAAVTAPARRTGWRVPAAIAAVALAIAGAGYWGYQLYEVRRAEQLRVEAQLAAQKQATEQAQRAAEEAKRDAQLQVQKLAAEEALRRAQEERNRIEQDRKLLDAERRTAEAAKRQAADEALRRAQEERAQLEQDRKRLEAEKQAAEAARKQAEASQRAASTAAKAAPGLAASHDGTYSGRLCNQFQGKAPECWPVALVVRDGVAEGNWMSRTQKAATARGTVAANGAVQLNLATWTPGGAPAAAIVSGRIVDGVIAVSGEWNTGGRVAGDWKRAQIAATAAPQRAARYEGTYGGQLCNETPKKAPNCWPLELVVRSGTAEGSWLTRTKNVAKASGVVAANGALEMKLSAWKRDGTPIEANLTGRIAVDSITASGRWRDGTAVSGNWKRKS